MSHNRQMLKPVMLGSRSRTSGRRDRSRAPSLRNSAMVSEVPVTAGHDHEIGEWQKTDRMVPFECADVSAIK